MSSERAASWNILSSMIAAVVPSPSYSGGSSSFLPSATSASSVSFLSSGRRALHPHWPGIAPTGNIHTMVIIVNIIGILFLFTGELPTG
jgi:hypothetical protein